MNFTWNRVPDSRTGSGTSFKNFGTGPTGSGTGSKIFGTAGTGTGTGSKNLNRVSGPAHPYLAITSYNYNVHLRYVYTTKPNKVEFATTKRIFTYIKDTKNYDILYTVEKDSKLVEYKTMIWMGA